MNDFEWHRMTAHAGGSLPAFHRDSMNTVYNTTPRGRSAAQWWRYERTPAAAPHARVPISVLGLVPLAMAGLSMWLNVA